MTVRYGQNLRLEIFGSSHGPGIGMRLDGFPSGIKINMDELQLFLNRRAPGRNPWSTSRKEPDIPVFTSGISADGLTDGNTICAEIENRDINKQAYNEVKNLPRPGHADYTAWLKYGKDYNLTGGGQFSGRMTAALCVAGAICKQFCESKGIQIISRIASIGNTNDIGELEFTTAENDFPTVSSAAGERMKSLILEIKAAGDSIGGIIECIILGCPGGLGGPLFEGLESRISSIVFSVPAVKGIEFGLGFDSATISGSENNDEFFTKNGKIVTKTNNCGGILGGISNGMPITFRAAIKPAPSIGKTQHTVNLSSFEETTIKINGRHDPCIVPRAVPCIEACAAIAICDALLDS